MNRFKQYFLTAIIAVPLIAGAQTSTGSTGTAPSQGTTTPNTTQAGGPMASSSAIKILSPKAGEKVTSSAISVQYELLNEGITAAGSPTYRLQLDSRDPVETTSTEQSFSGMTPGKHVLTVEVVDANHTPIMGSRTQVHFTSGDATAAQATGQASTQQQAPENGQQQQHPERNGQQTQPSQQKQQQAEPQQQSPRAELLPPSVTKATLPLPEPGRSGELPSAGGELPLLSMVGFGVLIGGVISAMRTRR